MRDSRSLSFRWVEITQPSIHLFDHPWRYKAASPILLLVHTEKERDNVMAGHLRAPMRARGLRGEVGDRIRRALLRCLSVAKVGPLLEILSFMLLNLVPSHKKWAKSSF